MNKPDRTCLFPAASGTLCGDSASSHDSPFPTCTAHGRQLEDWALEFASRQYELTKQRRAELHADRMRFDRERAEQAVALAAGRREAAEAAAEAERKLGIVYYLLRSDGMIKIGTTINPKQRIGNLKTAHGYLEVLATHGGGHKEETRRKNHFADLHVGGEWFRQEVPLLEWIVQVRKEQDGCASPLPPTIEVGDIRDIITEMKKGSHLADGLTPAIAAALLADERLLGNSQPIGSCGQRARVRHMAAVRGSQE